MLSEAIFAQFTLSTPSQEPMDTYNSSKKDKEMTQYKVVCCVQKDKGMLATLIVYDSNK